MPGRLSKRLIPSAMASSPATTSSNSIARRFDALKQNSRTALVCYVTAGHPDIERSLATLSALEEGGADVVELGVPFSDPIADGPIIQASSQRALDRGVTPRSILEALRSVSLGVPVVLMGYYNPILRWGLASFASSARSCGVAGVIVTDLK